MGVAGSVRGEALKLYLSRWFELYICATHYLSSSNLVCLFLGCISSDLSLGCDINLVLGCNKYSVKLPAGLNESVVIILVLLNIMGWNDDGSAVMG